MSATQSDAIDGLTTSVAVKAPCRVTTTANVTLSGLQTIASHTLLEGERVLLRGQTDATKNGIWEASAGAWRRARDFDGNRDVVFGTLIPIASDSDATIYYKVTTNQNPIIVDTHNITIVATNVGGVGETPVGYNTRRLTTTGQAILASDYFILIDCAGNSTHALPDPADVAGQIFEILNGSAFAATITATEFADGSVGGISSQVLGIQLQIIKVISNGVVYYVLQNIIPI